VGGGHGGQGGKGNRDWRARRRCVVLVDEKGKEEGKLYGLTQYLCRGKDGGDSVKGGKKDRREGKAWCWLLTEKN